MRRRLVNEVDSERAHQGETEEVVTVADKIYLLQPDGSLKAMSEAPYDSEALLQGLLEQYPDLLAGEDIGGGIPRRWVLVSREQGIPDVQGGGNRWSLDHLFLDQDAIPTLVEVKRSSDTRIRREVVGQMFDYAANAVVHWPIETIRAKFEARCEAAGSDPNDAIAELLGQEGDNASAVDTFWTSVRTNLQAGRIRLLFVADEIPPELRRIVEFLNAQMDPAEVIAVEVRQFVGENLKTLVPKVIGRTAAAERKRASASASTPWTEERFFDVLRKEKGEDTAATARRMLEWIRPKVTRVWWGRGSDMGSMVPTLDIGGGRVRGGHDVYFFTIWTYGAVEMSFQWLKTKPGFTSDETRLELVRRLNEIPGVDLPGDSIMRRPSFPIQALREPAALSKFQAVIEWGLRTVEEAAARAS